MDYCVYILTNSRGSVLYTGMTNNLPRRLAEHRMHTDPDSFTSRYHLDKLVWYEQTGDVRSAIEREKQIKGWNRARKIKLIVQKKSLLERPVGSVV